MKQGKLSNKQLSHMILSRIKPQNPQTVLGAGVGEDCCAVRFEGGLVVVSTDPITAAEENAGLLAVHINANDIAAAGARPVAALVTLLIPPSAKKEQIDEVFAQITETARSMDIDITGGHTEITDAVNRIVVSVTMMGMPVKAGRVMSTADMRAGDDILMTKFAGMEGTAILAADFKKELAPLLTDADRTQIEEIKRSLSVVPEGIAAAALPGVSAMHDITEGGVIGGIHEMCEAAGVGANVDFSKIPVMDVTRKICSHFGLDVFGLISSGSMLITAKDGQEVVGRLAQSSIRATIIGKAEGQAFIDARSGKELLPYSADQLYKAKEAKNRENG